MIDKAVELAKQKNLEVLARGKSFKHSFASICNEALADKASRLNISLGPSVSKVNENIGKIKTVEKSRMEKMLDSQPDLFLPVEIDLTLEDILENEYKDISLEEQDREMVCRNEEMFDSLESASCSRRSGKGKNKNKNHSNDW
jgi:DnaJ-class molecular chaperone